jgi:DNA replication protein DnaC
MAHSRIYDRLLSMCVPIRFTGVNFRQETAKRKMETMKKLLAE